MAFAETHAIPLPGPLPQSPHLSFCPGQAKASEPSHTQVTCQPPASWGLSPLSLQASESPTESWVSALSQSADACLPRRGGRELHPVQSTAESP